MQNSTLPDDLVVMLSHDFLAQRFRCFAECAGTVGIKRLGNESPMRWIQPQCFQPASLHRLLMPDHMLYCLEMPDHLAQLRSLATSEGLFVFACPVQVVLDGAGALPDLLVTELQYFPGGYLDESSFGELELDSGREISLAHIEFDDLCDDSSVLAQRKFTQRVEAAVELELLRRGQVFLRARDIFTRSGERSVTAERFPYALERVARLGMS